MAYRKQRRRMSRASDLLSLAQKIGYSAWDRGCLLYRALRNETNLSDEEIKNLRAEVGALEVKATLLANQADILSGGRLMAYSRIYMIMNQGFFPTNRLGMSWNNY